MKNHGVRFWQKKLGRTQSHRNSLAANLMTELVQHEQIQTTHAKAQVVKYHMEKLINAAKSGKPEDWKLVNRNLFSKETSIPKLMNTLANRYKDRSGGYVRILKNGHHASGSDRAPISIVELVNNPNDIIYNFAKRQINLVQKQLTDVESKKYHRELVVLRDPKTGALHNMYKLKPRADLTSKTLKQLNRVEIALHKQLVKFNRSLKTYPQARQYDADYQTGIFSDE
ncbi:ribosomal protein L17 [Globomyces pollinis-pini]|nr:ribosomal protein L17 [Globomyces pollinis-pini]